MWKYDIPKYFDEHLNGAIRLWNNYRNFGLPFTGGWAEQPSVYMDVLEVCESEYRDFDNKRNQ